jgi:glycosyltransferase involved in cell wall biosynthesis
MKAAHLAAMRYMPVNTRQPSLHVVHAVPSIMRSAGGTSTFVAELANHQVVDSHTAVTLLTTCVTADDVPLSPRVCMAPASGRSATQWLRKARDAAAIDLLHAHALWLPHTHNVIVAADSLGIPTVLSTHGMLEPYALRIKPWKKRLARFLYQDHDLRRANFLHATAMSEAENLRRFGLKQPIMVVPPGLELPPVEAMRNWNEQDRPQILFFSRIHPIKNLIGLIEAWAAIRPPEWTLRIVGPDEGGHAAAVQAKIAALGVHDSVTLEGPMYGTAKKQLFSAASVFILPSFTENFGIVVAEALAYGVPVITTAGTPWSELVDRACGWWVQPDHASLVNVLTEATQTSTDRLREMGLRGRTLVEEKYQWPAVRDAMHAAYLWVLGRGPQPDCVIPSP